MRRVLLCIDERYNKSECISGYAVSDYEFIFHSKYDTSIYLGIKNVDYYLKSGGLIETETYPI